MNAAIAYQQNSAPKVKPLRVLPNGLITEPPKEYAPVSIMPSNEEYKITKTIRKDKYRDKWITTHSLRLIQQAAVSRVYDCFVNEWDGPSEYRADAPAGVILRHRVGFTVPARELFLDYHLPRYASKIIAEREEEKAIASLRNEYFKYFIETITKEKVKLDTKTGGLVISNATGALTYGNPKDLRMSSPPEYVVRRVRVNRSHPTPIYSIGDDHALTYVPTVRGDTLEASVSVVGQSFAGGGLNPTTFGEINQAVANYATNMIAPYYMGATIAGLQAGGTTSSYLMPNITINSLSVDTQSVQDITWNGTELNVIYNLNYISDHLHLSASDTVKQAIRGNMRGSPAVINRAKSLTNTISPQEQKARDTLRDMISEEQYRRYLSSGFIMVRGQSTGHFYQVFMDHHNRIRVYDNGTYIKSLCIHTESGCPPTDHVISMKIGLEIDEEGILKAGNVRDAGGVSPPTSGYVAETPKQRIIDIFRSSKETENKYKNNYRQNLQISVAG